ncbi:uncharacterized protein B0H64DRAFT_407183 [Chaetomium fimeti]|uniref:Uncharacterized protein n=1 Tax=Chaetomium fimeti TaxID=1854472 RepID=A0AAE0LPI0_9PEZI|nr:hypothetical protein B0H64DRAFT_407183 [Chaetomium fimeti]
MNERSSTLRSSQDDDHAEKASKKEAKPKSAYSTDDFWIALRSVYALVMLGASAWIVDQGTKPTTNWIALPWAAYCIVCVSACSHLIITQLT